ncbi:hypothetical protein C2G38_2180039 [Gigaspora rosea]|uniref:Uncharacterized protein n=1 Tax=Gigaspora rosea TaxID=44941 RepID=A0A397VDR0_9GLOM|nr:hypothetical protein C2G38_2180039 [Gigaspora rosea]
MSQLPVSTPNSIPVLNTKLQKKNSARKEQNETDSVLFSSLKSKSRPKKKRIETDAEPYSEQFPISSPNLILALNKKTNNKVSIRKKNPRKQIKVHTYNAPTSNLKIQISGPGAKDKIYKKKKKKKINTRKKKRPVQKRIKESKWKVQVQILVPLI